MTKTTEKTNVIPSVPAAPDFHALLPEKIRQAVRLTLVAVLEEEVEQFIGAEPYERTAQRRDYRHGTYTRDLVTSVGPIPDLPVPRPRKGFRTQVFARYQRRQKHLDQAIGEMFGAGASTIQAGDICQTLLETHPSPTTVSRVFHTLEGEFTTWRQRELEPRYVYACADGTYFNVIYDDESSKMPILAVIGITPDGTREVRGFSVGERENQQAWEDLLANFKKRGVNTIDLWITAGNQAMLNAIQAQFPDSLRQRGVKHKMDHILSSGPTAKQKTVRAELRAIFYLLSREPDQSGPRTRRLAGQVRSHLSYGHRLSRSRSGRVFDLLCLFQKALADHSDHQRH